jgi:2-polyprenyl-3-methyl-5-hydroxy-6-metoxy-1,4-benzoquinol methylase
MSDGPMNDTTTDERFSTAYRAAVRDIVAVLPADQSAIARHNIGWRTGRFDPRHYLADSEARYRRAWRVIESAGARRVLDVGGFLAAFPLALGRLGLTVSVAEQFGYYDHALDGVADCLRSGGIEVIDTDLTRPAAGAAALAARYDAVTCMAVAEHLAHTPRHLLENIRGALKPGGSLVFEVPNLAYWPRRYALFFRGRTVLSPMDEVYHSAEPYTGHHREYTLDDARYVVGQAGFEIVSEQTFNYSTGRGGIWERLKYAPAYLLKEWAEVILLHCRKLA